MKFSKVRTCDGIVVLVPNSFYDKVLGVVIDHGVFKTRMYHYVLDSHDVLWRYPASVEGTMALYDRSNFERVVCQRVLREVFMV